MRKIVEDKKVINIWKCHEADCGEIAEITPDWYERNGIPVCFLCDVCMSYVQTQIEE